MPKFEYAVIRVATSAAHDTDPLAATLAQMADKGWRFVQAIGGETAPFAAVFEKEIQ